MYNSFWFLRMLYLEITSNLQENWKNNIKNSPIPYITNSLFLITPNHNYLFTSIEKTERLEMISPDLMFNDKLFRF